MFKYRDKETAAKIVKAIKDLGVKCRLMHVCGTHQDTIVRFGLASLLEDAGIEVHQGPGCPVCVTTSQEIADIITLARNGITVCAFGDMMRVPTAIGSLFDAGTDGCDVRIVYSIEDAVRMAGDAPAKTFVFAGVGFETTAPSTGVPLAKDGCPGNFSVYSCHRYTVPCIDKVLGMGEIKVDGLIEPGHVCVITGLGPFRKFSDEMGIPQAVCGFEPLDMLMSCYLIAKQIQDGRAVIENEYSRLVRDSGNERAKRVLDEVFHPADGEWRGFPVIEKSIMSIRPKFQDFDAKRVHEDILKLAPRIWTETDGCSCGEVLRGLIGSEQCPLFGTACKPTSPMGPCMVSTEGNCNIAYRFRGRPRCWTSTSRMHPPWSA